MTPEDNTVNELAALWWPLAVRTARRCARGWHVPNLADEFVSAAGEALLGSVRAYTLREKSESRPPVAAFVRRGVRWACYRVLQARLAERGTVSLEAVRGAESLTIGSQIPSAEPGPQDAAESAEDRARAAALLNRSGLTPSEREVALLYYGLCLTAPEVGTARGCSKQSAFQFAAAALRKLRAAAGVAPGGAPVHVKRAAGSRVGEILRMHAAGFTPTEIARTLKMIPATVWSAIQRETSAEAVSA